MTSSWLDIFIDGILVKQESWHHHLGPRISRILTSRSMPYWHQWEPWLTGNCITCSTYVFENIFTQTVHIHFDNNCHTCTHPMLYICCFFQGNISATIVFIYSHNTCHKHKHKHKQLIMIVYNKRSFLHTFPMVPPHDMESIK